MSLINIQQTYFMSKALDLIIKKPGYQTNKKMLFNHLVGSTFLSHNTHKR